MQTLTFLFTDIEGSTVLLRRLGQDTYARALADHNSIIRSALAAHDGEELNVLGDGFFAVFPSPRVCVSAVLEMQRGLDAHAWPAGERVRVRMGVHTGEAAETDAGLVGLDVNRAARVAEVAYGGQVLLSEAAAALAADSLPPGVGLSDLGIHRLKDLGRPERIFQLQAPGLQAEFPPLRSLANPALPNNLPAQLATFIGREQELSDVRALVDSSRLVTLTGAGGAGKTRLSLQVAAGLLDRCGDGVWLVELAAVTDEDAVAPAIAAALGIAREPGRPVLDVLLDALAPQDAVIVLDNCEHLIGACAKTADAILRRCPRVHLIVTSREPLGIGGEIIYRVPSLSLPGPGDVGSAGGLGSSDAVALLLERARQQGTELALDEQTAPLVVSICRRLDGMPLAIELAAARLRTLSLGSLRDRLDQRFRLLTGGSRTVLERQQTLEATVDWSYSLLNEAERLLLRRLSVFAESFDLDAAEAVCGFGEIEAAGVTGLLGSLVDKSLVQAEPAGGAVRYRLLETIREFAAQRLTEPGDGAAGEGAAGEGAAGEGAAGESAAAALAAAHAEHFLRVAEAAEPHLTGPDQGSWLARLDADQPNLRRAADYLAGRPDGTAWLLRLAAALFRYWAARSRDAEALALLGPALRRPDARADPRLFTEALVAATFVAHSIDNRTARQLGDQAVALARRLGDGRLLAEALTAQCGTCYLAGQLETALSLGQEAVERARRLGDDVVLGGSIMVFLMSCHRLDPARAEPLFTEA
ncbi:MAG TPA: adenylate/guanylate cyclase domain-containing protein, partial [Streptosporangiaceae bacterium]|nr:adenylate/guanylate cyclase domain-containing protein [Streptosporangiaceae bacterium]